MITYTIYFETPKERFFDEVVSEGDFESSIIFIEQELAVKDEVNELDITILDWYETDTL